MNLDGTSAVGLIDSKNTESVFITAECAVELSIYSLDDIYYNLERDEIDDFPLPFDPFKEDGRSEDVIDIVIEYFTNLEEYEKCEELVKIKNICQNSETQIE